MDETGGNPDSGARGVPVVADPAPVRDFLSGLHCPTDLPVEFQRAIYNNLWSLYE